MIHIRYASMNDVWGEISSLSTSSSTTVSKSSTTNSTETAATEHSQLIEALDLVGLPARKIGVGDVECDARSVAGDLVLEGEHEEDSVVLLEPQINAHAALTVEMKEQKTNQKFSHSARLLGKVNGQAKKMRRKLSGSKN